MQQNVKEVAICESGLFPCPYTEGKTFKTNPSNLSWSEFGPVGVGRADAKRGRGGGMGFFARKRVALPKYVNEQIDK